MIKMDGIYVFWDNSNIFISAQEVGVQRDGEDCRRAIRLKFANLMKLATCDRPVKKAIAVGSVPPEYQDLWHKMESETGINIELYERGQFSKQEQGVDQCLQTHMLRALADEPEPKIAVLLTGDGIGYEKGIGFLADLKRQYEKGWGIEVLSWDHSCNQELKNWAEISGVFVKLDDFYDSITFIESGRDEVPLSLTNRKCAQPRKLIDPEKEEMAKKIAEFEAKEKRKKKYGQKFGKSRK